MWRGSPENVNIVQVNIYGTTLNDMLRSGVNIPQIMRRYGYDNCVVFDVPQLQDIDTESCFSLSKSLRTIESAVKREIEDHSVILNELNASRGAHCSTPLRENNPLLNCSLSTIYSTDDGFLASGGFIDEEDEKEDEEPENSDPASSPSNSTYEDTIVAEFPSQKMPTHDDNSPSDSRVHNQEDELEKVADELCSKKQNEPEVAEELPVDKQEYEEFTEESIIRESIKRRLEMSRSMEMPTKRRPSDGFILHSDWLDINAKGLLGPSADLIGNAKTDEPTRTEREVDVPIVADKNDDALPACDGFYIPHRNDFSEQKGDKSSLQETEDIGGGMLAELRNNTGTAEKEILMQYDAYASFGSVDTQKTTIPPARLTLQDNDLSAGFISESGSEGSLTTSLNGSLNKKRKATVSTASDNEDEFLDCCDEDFAEYKNIPQDGSQIKYDKNGERTQKEESPSGNHQSNEKKCFMKRPRQPIANNQPKEVFCNYKACGKKLFLKPGFGRNRLVRHICTHWERRSWLCQFCDHRVAVADYMYYHHKRKHSGIPYEKPLNHETSNEAKALLDLWDNCFPDVPRPSQLVDRMISLE